MERIIYRQEEGRTENGHKFTLNRAKPVSSLTSTALSGLRKAWSIQGANFLTSQVGLAVPGCLVCPLLGAWLPKEELE